MRNYKILAGLLSIGLLLVPVVLTAQEADQKQAVQPQSSWSTFSRGGAVYQFDTDLDGGGNFSATRLNIQVGQGYSWDPRTTVSLAVSYSYDEYSFSGGRGPGLAALKPWDGIHSFSLSSPMRFGLGDNWTAFVIPSVSSSGESGASFDDTVTGGGLAGAAYRFGEWLTIGPGIGVAGQLEESTTIFPVLIIDWKITDRLSLETGRGLAATLGPGLTLNYKASQVWDFTLGGRYEKLRFRLDDNRLSEGGIGEDSSFPLFASSTYTISPKAAVSLVGGVDLGGELRVEDKNGNRIVKESYDPGVFLGLTFNVRL